jgi:hypothetical protein
MEARDASAAERGLQRSNNPLPQSFRLMVRVKRTKEPVAIIDLRWMILPAYCIFTAVKRFSSMLGILS